MIKSIGFFFLCFPVVMLVLTTMSFAIGWYITPLLFILSFVLTFVGLFIHKPLRHQLIGGAMVVGLSLLSTVIASVVYDSSCDGQWYHSCIIKLMSEGWNPFYNPILGQDQIPYHIDANLWTSHYAKGVETIEACVVSLTGILESGKAFNLMLLLALFCITFSFIGEKFSDRFNKANQILLSLTITANPVLINQVMTHYLDFTCYAYIVIGLFLTYNVLKNNDRLSFLGLVLIGFVIPTIKFNISFWFIVIILAFVLMMYIKDKVFNTKVFYSMLVSISLGFMAGGFNPYITNIIHKGNPVYPLAGKDKVDIMTLVTPKELLNKSTFYQVNISLASNPYSGDYRRHGDYGVFRINKEDIMDSPQHDAQMGGFGIFFFESLLFLLVAFATTKKTHTWHLVLSSCVFLYFCLFILPTSFYARYVPFFYLVPCLLIGYLLLEREKIRHIVCAYLAMSLLLADGMISVGGVCARNLRHRLQTDYLVCQLSKQKEPVTIKSGSAQLFDKLDKSKCKYLVGNNKMTNCRYYEIGLLGENALISINPAMFCSDEKPLLMKKFKMLDLKTETE